MESYQNLSPKRRHDLAARALRENPGGYHLLGFPPLSEDPEERSSRYHMHLREAQRSVKEHHLLVTTRDRLSHEPFLPLYIYLDHLRSAHNVGSIIRTTEALRLGTVVFSNQTPNLTNKKVRDTAMGAHENLPTKECPLIDLPRPFIGLETVQGAHSIYDFPFPKSFTLIVGNEEFGISKEVLAECDHLVTIPLVGCKNSLNVACAYAIAAGMIRHLLSEI
ncbi:MAG: TrmH family RNA methyltransferase [Simkaniaceae bacterium]|nr:TrmH family RNA methyltransferase [Simkaniaceae bacterium]